MDILFDYELSTKFFAFSDSGEELLGTIRGFVYDKIESFEAEIESEKGIVIIKILDNKQELNPFEPDVIGIYFLHFSKLLEYRLKKSITPENITYIQSIIKELVQLEKTANGNNLYWMKDKV